jgi:hypothetical protein
MALSPLVKKDNTPKHGYNILFISGFIMPPITYQLVNHAMTSTRTTKGALIGLGSLATNSYRSLIHSSFFHRRGYFTPYHTLPQLICHLFSPLTEPAASLFFAFGNLVISAIFALSACANLFFGKRIPSIQKLDVSGFFLLTAGFCLVNSLLSPVLSTLAVLARLSVTLAQPPHQPELNASTSPAMSQ